MLTLRRLRRRLTSLAAQTVVGPLTSEWDRVHCIDAAAIQLPLPRQLSPNRLQYLVFNVSNPTFKIIVFLIDHSNLLEQAKDRH